MRHPRFLASLAGAITLFTVLSATALPAGPAHADEPDSLAATPVIDSPQLCTQGAPTFDDVVTATATVLRGAMPADQWAAFDREVADFRSTLATARVHRGALPFDPATVGERPDQLDDPIVTYVVSGLDAVRTGQIHETMSLSQLTVDDAIEVFILATGIVKIPAKLAASFVPSVGIVLKPVVSAMFSGVKSLARKVQGSLAAGCVSANSYPALVIDESTVTTERLDVPTPIVDLANQLVRDTGSCTPVAELDFATVLERSRAYLNASGMEMDRAAMNATADSLQQFMTEHRIPKPLVMRRTENLGPLVEAIDKGPVTFLANLGYDLAEGTALDTVALGDIQVENALDLVTLTLDTTSLLTKAAGLVAGGTGVGGPIFDQIELIQKLAFAPADFGIPIVKGVMQSMCAV